MTRLPLALACTLAAAMATVASAQNYSGYAPGSMPGMPPGGGHPGMGMMPGGSPAGPPPGIFPGAANYHAAFPAPPTPKLPRGVNDEGGLLFYNGKPYQDVGYQHGRQASPVQWAAYQQPGPGGLPGAMSPPQSYPSMGQEYGMQPQDMSAYGDIGSGNACNNCNDPSCAGCRPRAVDRLFGWLRGDGRGLPGKMGSVWSFGAELVYYQRERAPDRTLVLDTFTQDPVFGAQDLSFDYEPGFRTWINYMGPSGIAIQAVFLQVNNMDASGTVNGDDNLQIPFPLAAFLPEYSFADRMTVTDKTNFNSAEVNVIYPWSSFQLLAGYRYVQVDETASLTAQSDIFGTNTYSTETGNRLHGAQIGFLAQWEAFGMVNFDVVAKTGLFGNATIQHQIVRGQDNEIVFRDTSGTDTDVAYVSELGVRAVFPLGPTFSLQAGYDVLFINRLALATQQFDFETTSNAGTQVQGGRNLVIHGISGGFTAKW